MSTFDLSSLPLINAYVNVNPKGEEEVFKDALGFERTGEIFLKQFEWGKIDMGSTFRHELVHVFVYYTLEKHTPVPNWFNEGIAQYYSNGVDMGVESWNRLTGQDKDFKVEAKEVDPTTFFRLEASTELRKGKPQGERFYGISLQLIKTLVEKKGGEEKLRQLLLAMKKGNSLTTGFKIVYDMTLVDLWNLWFTHHG